MERHELRSTVSATTSIGSSATFHLRTYFSGQHLQAAAHFTVQAHIIELEHKDREHLLSAEGRVQHRAYVTGAIFAAVAFLEAFINELFSDAADAHQRDFGTLDPMAVQALGHRWTTDRGQFRRYSILKKYETALKLTNRCLWDRGRAPYQHMKALTELRNALVHYKPEWARGGNAPSGKMASRMKSLLRGKFPLNPFVLPGNPFFPDQSLGHGVAQWAVESSTRFVHDFVDKLGVDHLKSRLPQGLSTCADGTGTVVRDAR